MLPIFGFRHVTVFHRIIMSIIQVLLEIFIIPNYVIPKPALPEIEIYLNFVSLLEIVREAFFE
jgi:hypothetical protein